MQRVTLPALEIDGTIFEGGVPRVEEMEDEGRDGRLVRRGMLLRGLGRISSCGIVDAVLEVLLHEAVISLVSIPASPYTVHMWQFIVAAQIDWRKP